MPPKSGNGTALTQVPAAAPNRRRCKEGRSDLADLEEAAIAAAAPAFAQDTTVDAVVVTGSRIQRRDFESNSPIVTVSDAVLKATTLALLLACGACSAASA